EANWRDAAKRTPDFGISESPAYVGRAVAALAQDPNVSRWNGQSLSTGELAKIYGFTDLDGSQPDAWRYIVEVREGGKRADIASYRKRWPRCMKEMPRRPSSGRSPNFGTRPGLMRMPRSCPPS